MLAQVKKRMLRLRLDEIYVGAEKEFYSWTRSFVTTMRIYPLLIAAIACIASLGSLTLCSGQVEDDDRKPATNSNWPPTGTPTPAPTTTTWPSIGAVATIEPIVPETVTNDVSDPAYWGVP